MRIFILCCLLGLILSDLNAQAASRPHQGYITDIQAEKSERFYEVYLLAPQKDQGPSLQQMIFSPLTKEFKEKYREQFGDLDTASINYRSSSFGGINENPKTLEEESDKRKLFAEYMTKRLVEYHVDNYMKTQPQMKKVMEVKQKIQNVKVEVSKDVRLNIQYNFAGNSADLILDNPWCDSKLTVEMDSHSFGPTTPQETRLWLTRNVNSHTQVKTNVALTDGIAEADLTRNFARWNMSASVGASTYFKESGTSPRETHYLVGFSHLF